MRDVHDTNYMGQKQSKPQVRDPGIALAMGDAFFEQANLFIKKIGPEADLERASAYAGDHLAEVMASATTMALALELYLKGLRILVGMNPSLAHNLWSLYKHLPELLKDSIEASYNQLNTAKRTDFDGCVLAVQVGPMPVELDQKFKESLVLRGGVDLKSVLRTAGDAFTTWRYLYEKGQSGELLFFNYEFKRLGFIASALRENALNEISKKYLAALKEPP